VTEPGADALVRFGWNETIARAAREAGSPDAIAGRVVRVDKGRATVITADDTQFAKLGGRQVATGDWVLIERGAVSEVLPRHSAFVRGDPLEGKAVKEQVVAANIDVVFVVQSLTNGPNPRRLERELVLAFESGAVPVVVLTKADAVDDATIAEAGADIAPIAAGADVIVTSARTGVGLDDLRGAASGNRTIALIGASGVGKSTLVNALVGAEVQPTGEVREGDQRGRHTTTARELVLIPGGGVLVDTPGLRAVSLWDADEGLSRAFADIESLAAQCKFNDCSHRSEPGCAVLAAIAAGDLDRDRYDHYVRLDAELDAAERRRQGRILSKAQKAMRKLPR
jgi:ribosome biogenesis GTPase